MGGQCGLKKLSKDFRYSIPNIPEQKSAFKRTLGSQLTNESV